MQNELTAHSYTDCYVYPTRRDTAYPGKLLMGAFDSLGNYIQNTVLERRSGEVGFPRQDVAVPLKSDRSIEEAIYAGPLYNHFGHFLLESLARLWFAKQNPGIPIIWAAGTSWKADSFRPWQLEILSLLGLTSEIYSTPSPVHLKKLHVPDCGYIYDHQFHVEHSRFLACYGGIAQQRDYKIWLSRSRICKNVRDINSESLENRLRDAGWKILYPEHMSVTEQLNEMAKASRVAGEEGSAFHLLLLLKNLEAKRFDIFRRSGPEHKNLHTIGNVRKVDQHFHTVGGEKILYRPTPSSRAIKKISPNSSSVMNALRIPVKEKAIDEMAHSVRRVNFLGEMNNARQYLELGADDGRTLLNVKIERKYGVSTWFKFDIRQYENEQIKLFELPAELFFTCFAEPRLYDLIFLNDVHYFSDVIKLFIGSVPFGNQRTIWIIDNIFPVDAYSAHVNQKDAVELRKVAGNNRRAWHGDVYKFVYFLHDFLPQYSYLTIATNGNPQLLIWNQLRENVTPQFGSLEAIARLTYFDIHQNLDVFHMTPEGEVHSRLMEWIEMISS